VLALLDIRPADRGSKDTGVVARCDVDPGDALGDDGNR
jgi:hypothetical protein